MNQDSINPEFGQRILDALNQRAPIKRVREGEYRTTCLRPERHKHGDAHPSMDFNPEKGAICRVCGFKAGLVTLARELGVDTGTRQKIPKFKTAEEAIRALIDQRKLRTETIAHFGITADVKRQAWTYPLPSGHRRWKAFDSSAAPKKYWHERGTPNQLYGLDEVTQGSREVLLVNGEPAVWVCYQAGISAICGIYGEGRLPDGALNALVAKGVRTITIVPDLDEPGDRAAISTFDAFLNSPAFKRVVPPDKLGFPFLQLPWELGASADVVELYVWCDGNDEHFRDMLANLPRLSLDEFQKPDQTHASDSDPLIGLSLFHDQHNEPYATFKNDGRQHIHKVTTTAFR